jgi:endo-1,4-beta-xylanase
MIRRFSIPLCLTVLALGLSAVADAHSNRSRGHVPQEPTPHSCGYRLSTGTFHAGRHGYHAWVKLLNVSGETATDFEVSLDLGDAVITKGFNARYQQTDGGYSVTNPFWFGWLQEIWPRDSYLFHFKAQPEYRGVTPYLVSVNGISCDTEPPALALTASGEFFNAEGTLTLTADATDNVTIRKVVFEQDGAAIGEDREAPFALDVAVNAGLNGYHLYTAKAYDASGNETAAGPARMFAAINNKFLGTATTDRAADYEQLLDYFNQLTPGNAGKWGVVEATRNAMNWDSLDVAYHFARDNGLPFKFHTLIWGNQQPNWLAALTVEEQRAEIEEWMTLVSERYPDLEMIDVVNEPLHAPPGYKNALGGDGATGWDWVITSFELARKYFPRSQLILNDYQILHLPEFTQDYLEIINLLNDRGLIDAIGEQAHFLERTQPSMVQTNLDTLAATGLPIYISELDVNFPDDARHAHVLRGLFTVFWQHPAVVGVTHWGHLQGNMFRPDAYLLRLDGTTRPGLDWLMCYIAGGTDCTVPDYIPSGWQGLESGLTLEAELHDEGHGLVGLGDIVAFTDNGDWIAYSGVEFREAWDIFSINYAKGNQSVGNISIHLDSLDNAPVLTVPLEFTGGWGTSRTLEVPWDSISGRHDVYIRFNDAFGVGNVDNLSFGSFVPPDPNLVTNGGFETGSVAGWQSWNGSTLTVNTTEAYSGTNSLLASNRPNTGQFAVYSLNGLVTPNTAYAVSARVRITGAVNSTVRLAAKVQCANASANFPWLHNHTGVTPGVWTQLAGILTIPNCAPADVAVFFEGTPVGIDVYIDEVRVIPFTPSASLIPNSGFESASLAGWQSWNGSTLSLNTSQAYTGVQSLLASNRPGTTQFAVYNVTSLVTPGTTYAVSARTLITGATNNTVRLAAKVQCAGSSASFPWIHNNTDVVPGVWTQLIGTLPIPNCTLAEVSIFFEGTPVGVDVYLDDITVVGF